MKPRDNPGLVSVWDKAKNDYLEGNYESLHGLAKKWEVNYNTLCDRVYKGIKIDKAWRDEKKAAVSSLILRMLSYRMRKSGKNLLRHWRICRYHALCPALRTNLDFPGSQPPKSIYDARHDKGQP